MKEGERGEKKMPGRPPKSSKLHLLEKEKVYGDLKDRLDAEPQQKDPDLKPLCPKIFTTTEKKIWHKYSAILEQFGLFNLANASILELLVKNMSDRDKCIKRVKDEGIVIDSKRGKIYNPYWSAKNRCEENIIKYLNLLGLSSMGLAKLGCLQIRSKEKKTGMAKLLDKND